LSFAFVHHAGIVAESKNHEGAWAAIATYTGKSVTPLWMEHHGWPTARMSYLQRYVQSGTPPPHTRQNVVEWIKAAPVITFPVGSSNVINPLASERLRDAIEGRRSVRDVAQSLAQEITNALEKA
jgi:ABC-type glycerol-3-phosphate transport system substrate-binding protein